MRKFKWWPEREWVRESERERERKIFAAFLSSFFGSVMTVDCCSQIDSRIIFHQDADF